MIRRVVAILGAASPWIWAPLLRASLEGSVVYSVVYRGWAVVYSVVYFRVRSSILSSIFGVLSSIPPSILRGVFVYPVVYPRGHLNPWGCHLSAPGAVIYPPCRHLSVIYL